MIPLLLVEQEVRRGLLEDFGRAGDITTEATVPADRNAVCALVARDPGTIAGLDFARIAFTLVDPDDHLRHQNPRRHPGRPRRCHRQNLRPGARHPHRRARRAEFPRPPFRHRHRNTRHRRPPSPTPRPASPARAKPRRDYASRRNTRCAAAAAPTTVSASMTRS